MGRNLLALLVAVCAILLQSTASAATPEFQIVPRVGLGSLRVDEFVGINRQRVNADTYGIGASAGYLTPIGVVVEIGADSFSNFNLFETFDDFQLSQEFASIGYQFELGNRCTGNCTARRVASSTPARRRSATCAATTTSGKLASQGRSPASSRWA